MKNSWAGEIPQRCDICGETLFEGFVDGRIRNQSVWAIMCPRCYKRFGAGLGTGKGQKYNVKGEQE